MKAAKRIAATPRLEDVRAAYRLILGREPENEAVLERHLASGADFIDLGARFLNSEEYKRRGSPGLQDRLTLAPAPLPIEDVAAPAALAAMLDRVGGYWATIGQAAPHWSVLTQNRFRPETIAETRGVFYATGAADRALVRDTLTRHGMDAGRMPRLVEFGCGVGRATLHLAGLFPNIVGCDVSQPHLDLAEQEAMARAIKGIDWYRSTIAAPLPEGGWDCWFSRLVLQHNPPPVMAHLLRLAFAGLRPGGCAIFQLPTYHVEYRFSVADYLARRDAPDMEMHVLPQASVFALAAAAGLEVLEVREDTHLVTSNPMLWVSNLFVLRRPV